MTGETQKSHHVAHLKTPTIAEPAKRKLPTTKDIPPKSAGDVIPLIDLSSDDEKPKSPPKTGHLLDMEVLADFPILTPQRASLSEPTKQLLGLELGTPSHVQALSQFIEIAAPELKGKSEDLLDLNAHATGMVEGLGECLSIVQNKISDALQESKATEKQPPRVSTPENTFLSPQDG